MGWRYHRHLLDLPNEEFPWITPYRYVDDTDVAIDLAEALSLQPDQVLSMKRTVLEPLKEKKNVDA